MYGGKRFKGNRSFKLLFFFYVHSRLFTGVEEEKTGTLLVKKFSTESVFSEKLLNSSARNEKNETLWLQKFASSPRLVPQFYLTGGALGKKRAISFLVLNENHVMFCPIHKNANSFLSMVFGFLAHADKYRAFFYTMLFLNNFAYLKPYLSTAWYVG